MSKKKQEEGYLYLVDKYRSSLFDLMEERGQKAVAAAGFTTPQATSSWKKRGSLPDVVTGCIIAREYGTTADAMVYHTPQRYFHKSDTVQDIVRRIEDYADNDRLMIEIDGLVKRHLSDYAQEQKERENA